jgi:beta-glucosidase
MHTTLFLLVSATLSNFTAAPVDASWEQKVRSIQWVAFAPTQANPHMGVEAPIESVQADLDVLRNAGFTGLITYGSAGRSAQALPELAAAAGFTGLVPGIWDPANPDEIAAAIKAARSPIVMGICVGNEGRGPRYDHPTLAKAMDEIRKATGKPVTTTEELEDYSDPQLLALGDWVFPNVHPYWHEVREVEPAVRWTAEAYEKTTKQAGRFVWLKETGLPTAGHGGLSAKNQDKFYAALSATDLAFVYFEAFDQPWKNHEPVEPFWGLFDAHRKPKACAVRLMRANGQTVAAHASAPAAIGSAMVSSQQRRPSAVTAASHDDDAHIEKLIDALSLEEKLGQLTQQWGGEIQDVNPVVTKNKQSELDAMVREGKVGSYLGAFGAAYINHLQRIATEESKHRIPLIIGNDVIHGYRTTFPIPFAEACTWDPQLVEKAARIAATEARAAGTHWTFAPMVDITRDPRWGRIAEGAGEDPYLGAVLAAARVHGFQGTDVSAPDAVLACAKHYVAYGSPEGGRDYNTVDISERTLREIHLPPFKAAVEAGTATLMTAFNEINGIPATGNTYTLRTILREEYGFDGFLVSDWNSVGEMVAHGYARDGAHAAEIALAAGVDMDMSSFLYRSNLAASVVAGRVSLDDVNQAVRRVLRMKQRLGLFENPYVSVEREKELLGCAAHRQVAREVARSSIVLLKNDNLLPFKVSSGKMAVIGPLADSGKDMLGTWASVGKAEEVVTILQALRERAGDRAVVKHVAGCEVTGDNRSGIAEAVKLAEQSDVAVLVLGESENLSGEAYCRSRLGLPGVQTDLMKAVIATGKPTVVVLVSGRPLATPWAAKHAPALLSTWHLGVEHGNAVADVLFGDFNPAGRLVSTVPRNVGQVPIYYAHKNTGRPPNDTRYTSKYIDVPWTPLYPFGFGLSYTTFKYENLEISPGATGPAGAIEVSATVRNTGKTAGHEVAQLYYRDRVASVTRPVRQLAGFERIFLKPGESRTVKFILSRDQLGFWDQTMSFVVEPGTFDVWIGPDATRGLQGQFEIR